MKGHIHVVSPGCDAFNWPKSSTLRALGSWSKSISENKARVYVAYFEHALYHSCIIARCKKFKSAFIATY